MGDKFKKLFSTKSIYEIEKNLFKKNIPGFFINDESCLCCI